MSASNPHAASCWLCGSSSTKQIHQGVAPSELTPQHFAITDAHYGKTLSIYQCSACGFRFCPDAGDVTEYYEALEDQEYERTRDQRSLQAAKLIKIIRKYAAS